MEWRREKHRRNEYGEGGKEGEWVGGKNQKTDEKNQNGIRME